MEPWEAEPWEVGRELGEGLGECLELEEEIRISVNYHKATFLCERNLCKFVKKKRAS